MTASATVDDSRIQNLSAEVTALRHQLKRSTATEASLRADFSTLQAESEGVQRRLNDQITELTDALSRSRDTERRLNSQVIQLTQTIAGHEANVGRLERAVRAADEEHRRMECEAAQLRSELQQARQEVARSEARRKQLKGAILALQQEGARLAGELREANKKAKRDARSGQAASEAACAHRLREAKAMCEAEKRRIFAFAADEFRAWFTAAETPDEQSYQKLLHRVKAELTRLIESDTVIRRLIGPSPRQATDDAVARFVNV
jgi:chromosome segregation ATPase